MNYLLKLCRVSAILTELGRIQSVAHELCNDYYYFYYYYIFPEQSNERKG